MKLRILGGAAGLALAAGAGAGDIYSNKQEFLTAIGNGSDLNPFDGVRYGYDGPLSYWGDRYWYHFSAPGGLFCGDGNVSTKLAGDPLVIDFADAPVVAVGGNFWVRDAGFNVIPGEVTVVYSDGTKDVFSSDAPETFRGYVSIGARISQVAVRPGANGGKEGWVVLDNFYTLRSGVFTNNKDFQEWFWWGYVNGFDDVESGPIGSLGYGQKLGFEYAIGAPSGLFCGAGEVSTAVAGEPIVIGSTGREMLLSGGNFWVRDADFHVIPGKVTLRYSDGNEDVFVSAGKNTFRGYWGHEPITEVQVFGAANGGADGWPVMDNLWVGTVPTSACYADCDDNGRLDLFDFLCFVGEFNLGARYGDCDRNGAFDLFDFLCYQNSFNESC